MYFQLEFCTEQDGRFMDYTGNLYLSMWIFLSNPNSFPVSSHWPYVSFIITLVCLIYLCSGVCVTLRCAVPLTRCFHNAAPLNASKAVSRSGPQDFFSSRGGVVSFSICRRTRFNDLSNLQLTSLKVSYDLIETDYGDNSITHNHVG